ncbi:hypothetical protein BC830DRAFT_1139676 [Chytriomyces sp. MP71]|nr:hypothetical protein BC830DRAFT_1139676 [Chytriomyces sp. MP71]
MRDLRFPSHQRRRPVGHQALLEHIQPIPSSSIPCTRFHRHRWHFTIHPLNSHPPHTPSLSVINSQHHLQWSLDFRRCHRNSFSLPRLPPQLVALADRINLRSRGLSKIQV